jgi:TRAP-type C4-dicarboxylate transport system permease small subunit
MNIKSRQTIERTEAVIRAAARVLGYICMGVIAAMAGLTFFDVLLRYIFNRPISGSVELTQMMMVTLAFTAIVWTTEKNAHIMTDILSMHFPSTVNAFIRNVSYFLFLVIYSLIAWCTFKEGMLMHHMGSETDVLGIPMFPFYLIVVIGSGMVALLLAAKLAQNIAQAVNRWR